MTKPEQKDVHLLIPDTKLAREITEFIQDTETSLLFNHSSRVHCFAAISGTRQGEGI